MLMRQIFSGFFNQVIKIVDILWIIIITIMNIMDIITRWT